MFTNSEEACIGNRHFLLLLLLLHLEISTLVHQIQVPAQLNYFLQFTPTPLVLI